jgi:hypothetical protein
MAQCEAQPIIFLNEYIIFSTGKSTPKIWTAFVIFKKLPNVNTCPIGENSSNLVTLVVAWIRGNGVSRFLNKVSYQPFAPVCPFSFLNPNKLFPVFHEKVKVKLSRSVSST